MCLITQSSWCSHSSIIYCIHITHNHSLSIPSGISPHNPSYDFLSVLTVHVMSHITIILKVKDSVHDFLLLSFNFHILKPGSLNIMQYVKMDSLERREYLQFLFANLMCRIKEMQRSIVMEHWGCQEEDFKTWECKRHFYLVVQVCCLSCLT